MKDALRHWRVPPGTRVRLEDRQAASTARAPGGREETEAAVTPLQERMLELQGRLYAEGSQSLLVVLQGMDASGKDGTVKHVFRGVNPQATRVSAFKQPVGEELLHDFLWRVHRQAPRAGEVVVFNRSHYEDVLVVRVHELVPEEVWRPRYERIVDFERQLASAGTRVVKLLLHVSEAEQLRRLLERRERPDKQWKLRPGDFDDRALWRRYRTAFEDALAATSTAEAPWYVVPADHKWYRNWVVSQILVRTLEEMDPRYPCPDPELLRAVDEAIASSGAGG